MADSIFRFAGIPNPLDYPCPITLLLLGVGLLLFAIGSKAFKKQ